MQTMSESAYALCAAVDSIKKPLAVAIFTGGRPETVLAAAAARDILTKAGIAVFSGVESAARAIAGIQNIKSPKVSKYEILNFFERTGSKSQEIISPDGTSTIRNCKYSRLNDG
jgi:acyl-CoA synthetase (NDP forming)